MMGASSPEDDVEGDEHGADHAGPEDRPLPERHVLLGGDRRAAVDQADQLLVGLGRA